MIPIILELLSVPIIFFNMFGGIVAGIWLAFLGEWRLIFIGIILLFTAHFFISLLMLPGLFLGMVAGFFHKKNNFLFYIFAFLCQFFTNFLILGTCFIAFYICTNFYTGESKFGIIPYLLWSWGMALGPWQFFASKEPENEFSCFTVLVTTIFYLLFLISLFLGPIFVLLIICSTLLIHLLVLPIYCIYVSKKEIK